MIFINRMNTSWFEILDYVSSEMLRLLFRLIQLLLLCPLFNFAMTVVILWSPCNVFVPTNQISYLIIDARAVL
jgi:hypothetical protein